MKRLLLLAVLALSVAAPVASSQASPYDGVYQSYFFSGWQAGLNYDLYLSQRRPLDATAISAPWTVTASVNGLDNNNNWFFKQFNTQTVPSSAVSFDPLGNSGSLQAVLIASDNTAGQFNLTFTRPRNLYQCATCDSVSPWIDPSGAAGGHATVVPAFSRSGYTIRGLFSGFNVATNSYGQDNYSFGVYLDQDVTAP